MRWNRIWILVCCAALAVPAYAQFYKYKDSEGNIRFTDDLNQIPEHLRSGATPYEQAASPPEASSLPEKPEESQSPTAKSGDEADLNQARQALEDKKKQLEAEHNALMEKRAALEGTRKARMTRTQALDYNKAVAKLNDEMLAYEKRRNAFEAEVEVFNERLKAKTAPTPTP